LQDAVTKLIIFKYCDFRGKLMPDATSVLNEISGALSSLATQIQSLFPESPSFAEIWNWQQPGITRDDLFDRVQH
jgi:hypothetical protein